MENYSSFSDESLQALAASGDNLAEEVLIQRYSRLVRICARPYFLAGGDSEDLTQEGMLGLLSAIRRYNSQLDTSFHAFAQLCIKRRIQSAVKSASRLKHAPLNEGLSLDEILSDASQTHTAPIADIRRIPEEQVLARESETELFTTYSRCLSHFESEILRYYLQGLSYQEIAAATGRPVKSVDNAVQRIRRKLAQ